MDVTVILPIHRLNDNTETLIVKNAEGNDEEKVVQSEKDYFASAIAGIREQKVLPTKLMIVIPKGDSELKKTIEEYDWSDELKGILTIVENDGETDFCSQINFGVEQCDTEWFSILELDDEYSKIWFENVQKYMEAYDDVDGFLPIVLDVSVEGRFLHFTNEPVWAPEFSDKMGFIDNDALLNFPNFQISGGVYRKEAFKSVGGLKPSIKLQFTYEFFLRMTYYDKTIMTIPKLGYKKTNMRPDSLFYNYQNSEEYKMDPVEARWWFNTARKECYFKNDRDIKYDVNEETV
jgi:hypothetical protein